MTFKVFKYAVACPLELKTLSNHTSPDEVVVSRFISDHFATGQLPINESFLTLTYIFDCYYLVRTYGGRD